MRPPNPARPQRRQPRGFIVFAEIGENAITGGNDAERARLIGVAPCSAQPADCGGLPVDGGGGGGGPGGGGAGGSSAAGGGLDGGGITVYEALARRRPRPSGTGGGVSAGPPDGVPGRIGLIGDGSGEGLAWT